MGIRGRWAMLVAALLVGSVACGAPQPPAAGPATTLATIDRAGPADPPSATADPNVVGGLSGGPQTQPLSTTDYEVVAGELYRDRAAAEQMMDTIARTPASAASRADAINNQLLPYLENLLTTAQAAQPADPGVASLHQHLINSLQLTIAAYHDLANGLVQNDAGALAQGRAELTAEGQELAIWVHGVPGLYH
jgi:hypothetical protein